MIDLISVLCRALGRNEPEYSALVALRKVGHLLAHLVWSCGIEVDIVIVYDRRWPTGDLISLTRSRHELLLVARMACLSVLELNSRLSLGRENETRLCDSLIDDSTVDLDLLVLGHNLPLKS